MGDLSDSETETVQEDVKAKKGKKNKKDGDNLDKDLEKLNLEDSSKKDKKSKKKVAVSDDSDEEGTIKPQKGGFALLMDDGGDSLPSEESEPEVEVAPKKSKD